MKRVYVEDAANGVFAVVQFSMNSFHLAQFLSHIDQPAIYILLSYLQRYTSIY